MVSSIWTCSSASMPPTRVEDLAIDGVHGLLHALAEIARLVAVAQLDRLMRAGGGARRHRRAAHRAVFQHHIDLDGGIAAAVENFAADDVDDGGHGCLFGRCRDWTVGAASTARLGSGKGRDAVTSMSRLSNNAATETASCPESLKHQIIVRPATRPRRGMAHNPGRGKTRPRAQSAKGHQLSGAVHRAGIHLALPGHRPAGFRPSRDRLCARANGCWSRNP